jgi:hypothetical protein
MNTVESTGNGRGVEAPAGSKSGPTRGAALMDDPRRNKGTAFTLEERRQYGLEGLLPRAVETLERQVERVMQHLEAKPNDLERYVYLIGLADRNETLFYRTVMSDPARFIPILYDPTVADACLAFGHIYRRARGLYVTREMKGRMADVMRNWPERDIRFVCVSSGAVVERHLPHRDAHRGRDRARRASPPEPREADGRDRGEGGGLEGHREDRAHTPGGRRSSHGG